MDKTMIGIIITQGVVVILFIILHYIVDPFKENKKFRKEQLLKFYAPLYAMLVARGSKWLLICELNNGDRPEVLMFSSTVDGPNYLTREWMEQFIHDNVGYANIQLIEAWTGYVSSPGKRVSQENVDKLCIAIVKEYNQLRKEFGLEFSKEELRTGIPEIYAYLRENH